MALSGMAGGAARALRQQQQDVVSLQDLLMQRALQERQMLLQAARDAEQRRQFDVRSGQDQSQFDARMGQDQSQFDARMGQDNDQFTAQHSRLLGRDKAMDTQTERENRIKDEALSREANARGLLQRGMTAVDMKKMTPIQAYRMVQQEGADIPLERFDPEKEQRDRLDQIAAQGKNLLDVAKVRADDSNRVDSLALRRQLRMEPEFKTALEVRNGYDNVNVGTKLNNAQGDLAIVNGMAKMLDPTGVVRPSEFMTVEEAQGFMQRMMNIPGKISEGDRLLPEVRQRFLAAANRLYIEKRKPMRELIDQVYTPMAKQGGFSISDIVPSSFLTDDIGSVDDPSPVGSTEEEITVDGKPAIIVGTDPKTGKPIVRFK